MNDTIATINDELYDFDDITLKFILDFVRSLKQEWNFPSPS